MNVEKLKFVCVAEAVAHFYKKGFITNEFESRVEDNKRIRVMVSPSNPREYVEIIHGGFLDVSALYHKSI
jgi:hypothetical protein